MALTDAEIAFLSQTWRYVESNTAAIKTAHPGAREADRNSPFITSAGAGAVLYSIHSIVAVEARLFQVTVDGMLSLSFSGSTPNVMLYSDRFDLAAGRHGIVVRLDRLWGKEQTLLQIWG